MTILTVLTVVLMSWVGCSKKNEDPGVALKVTSTNPITNAVGVAVNSTISAKFSAGLDAASVTSTSFILMQGTTAVAGAVTAADSTATFTPAANLSPTVVYTATIKTTVKSKAGKNLGSEYTWNFTSGATPDTTKPTVTLTEPASDATAVALNRTVVVTFSKAMDQTTLNATNFTLKQGTTAVAGAVTSTSTKATFTPAVNLEGSKVYTATISGVKDVAGNVIAANYTFSFTTVDVTPPTVTQTDPLNNATGVAVNKAVKITFSKAMDAATITATTITMKQGTTAVAGAVTYASNIATFTPTSGLAAGTVYAVTVSTGAKDLAGNALANNLVVSFTTAANSGPLAVVNLGSSVNYVILAKTAITNITTSAITGDLGLSPAAQSYITGFSLTNATGYATSSQVTGKHQNGQAIRRCRCTP